MDSTINPVRDSRIRPGPKVTYGANGPSVQWDRASMDSSAAIYVAVALVCTGLMGAAFARWRRALTDLRKTKAGVGALRTGTIAEFRRMVMFGGLLALLAWLVTRQG